MNLKHLPKYLAYPVVMYAASVLLMTMLRLVFIVMTRGKMAEIPGEELPGLLAWASWMGWRYDTIATTYLLAVPFLMLAVAQLSNFHRAWYFNLVSAVSTTLFSLAILCSCADIPYFKYYDTRVSVTIFQWLDGGITTLEVLVEEPSYVLSGIVFVAASFLFAVFARGVKRRVLLTAYHERQGRPWAWVHAVYVSVTAALIFHGAKANFKSPIKVIDAMKTPYSYVNQLALNPVFTLVKSYLLNKKMDFMAEDVAVANARRFLGVRDTCFSSPLSRVARGSGRPSRPNIVLVFMESQASVNMAYSGNPSGITPNLDSLAGRSIFFDNVYSTGIHTHNAIFSTLWAYPTLSQVRQMSANNTNRYTGLPALTKSMGYKNIFFVTHDKRFDNIADFILGNDFDTLVSREDYPDSLSVNAFGIPDHVMLDRAIEVFNQAHARGEKFFGAILTNSNHMPYAMPGRISFKPRSKTIDDQMIEYADWAVGQFMEKAREQPWFDSTIFVLVGDHGQLRYHNAYDMPLTYNHVPLIIHAPGLVPLPRVVHGFGGQCDIFPTVMGLLGETYVNNTPGIDLLREQRPCVFFTADYKIGCINDEFFYVYRESGGESLYKYRDNDLRDYREMFPAVADSMKRYALSMIQASQINIKYNRTAPDTCR